MTTVPTQQVDRELTLTTGARQAASVDGVPQPLPDEPPQPPAPLPPQPPQRVPPPPRDAVLGALVAGVGLSLVLTLLAGPTAGCFLLGADLLIAALLG